MKLLKKITILLCFLSLIAFVSCSAEDKSGVKEKDNADGTEITGGGKSGNSGTDGGSGTGGSAGTVGGSGTGGSAGTGEGSGTGGTSGTGEGSGTGGTSETGGSSGTGGSAGTGGGSGTGGGTETTITGKFYPPAGTYKDKDGKNDDTEVTIEGEKTKMKGRTTNSDGEWTGFGFNITEWKKTTKDGKDIKLESVNATDANGWGHSNISIVYYYDTQTLNITYDSALHGNGYSFIGTKQP